MARFSRAFLAEAEVEALLAAPDRRRVQGRRDYALLLLLYKTGAPACEAAGSRTPDLCLHGSPEAPEFLNKQGRRLTRHTVYALVMRSAQQVARTTPSLAANRVSPHTLRHATAVTLLRTGVGINTIRAWMGHVSLETTN